jgi:hypothetical protein
MVAQTLVCVWSFWISNTTGHAAQAALWLSQAQHRL